MRVIIGLLTSITETLQGRVVKAIGDGVMCTFPTADLVAAAAGDMQVAVSQLPPDEGDRKLTIRIGYHFGPVIQSGEDAFGDCVNIAARMASLALAGQILTIGETGATLSVGARHWLRRLDALPVKGKSAEIDVYEQFWQSNTALTNISPRERPSVRPTGPKLTLHRGHVPTSRVFFNSVANLPAGLVVVEGPMISRQHARIEQWGRKFVLVDRSSNGTYVTLGNHPEIHLRQEELMLHGNGTISFGQSVSVPGAEVVEFHCIRMDGAAGIAPMQRNYRDCRAWAEYRWWNQVGKCSLTSTSTESGILPGSSL